MPTKSVVAASIRRTSQRWFANRLRGLTLKNPANRRVGADELMMSGDDVLMMPVASGRNEFSLITPMKTLAEVSSLFRFLAESGFDGSIDSRFGEAVIDRFF